MGGIFRGLVTRKEGERLGKPNEGGLGEKAERRERETNLKAL